MSGIPGNQRPSMPLRQSSSRTDTHGHARKPSLNGQDCRRSGSIGVGPNAGSAGSRRASVQIGSMKPALISSYTYAGMLGKCRSEQNDSDYSFNLITPNGEVKKTKSDLATNSYKWGALLFQNSWDGKLYDGSTLNPPCRYSFAGFFQLPKSYNMYMDAFDFAPGEWKKLEKGDAIWYHAEANKYYAAKSLLSA